MPAIGSLFSGIGGLDLGLERATGWRTLVQVEQCPHARRVLRHHWPDATLHPDVRHVGNLGTAAVCGGFPCQDLSQAARGRNEGLSGDRSSLWNEMLRIIDATRPVYVLAENVAGAATKRWLPFVRRDLHGIGYASVPLLVRACDIGAPQRGARIFVAATPYSHRESVGALHAAPRRLPEVAAHLSTRGWPSAPTRGVAVVDGLPHSLAMRLAGNAVVPRMAECAARASLPE